VTGQELRAFDRVYAASVTWPQVVAHRWGVSVQPLLQATDPALFHPGDAEFDSGAEVLFIGNARRVFRPAVRHTLAIGADLELHGDGWEQFVEPRRIASSHVDNSTLAAKYAASGVVLNDHWEDMRKLGFVSNRLIDAAASGARVASDVVPDVDLTAMFHGLVRTWSDEDDLRRIVEERDTLYPTGEERRRAAEAVAAEHSFDARARTFVDDAVRLLHERRADRGERPTASATTPAESR
jgi:spore maturation protein CgeB